MDKNRDGDVDLEEFIDLVKSNLIKAGIYSENWDKKINKYLFIYFK